jgi:starch synthase
MADKKKVLLISQEMHPFTENSEMSQIAFQTAQTLQEQGADVRVLMPRFGTINERKHRLHEVVRLSGMNISVDEDDYPLIIKVASLPGTRLQVYFLENDEFFKRKEFFVDAENQPFADNLDRFLFFGKSVLETVKKFGWSPDIVHCHGFLTSLIPAMLKTSYRQEPVFQSAKVVYSAYPASSSPIDLSIAGLLPTKLQNNQLGEVLEAYLCETNGVCLDKGAATLSDGLINNTEDASLEAFAAASLNLADSGAENYLGFFQTLSIAEPVK